MLFRLLILALLLTLLTLTANAGSAMVPAQMDASSPYILSSLAKRLENAARDNKEYSNSTSIDKSFRNATVFKFKGDTETPGNATAEASIEVICKFCYFKGNAAAKITVKDDFNASQAYHTLENSVSGTMRNLTKWVEDIDLDISEASLVIPPPANINFEVEIPDFPDCILELTLDDAELYVELSTTFGAGLTYTLLLFTKPLGVELGDDLFLGLIFSVDLILSLESQITIEHGFHIKLDEGLLLRMAMFSKEASAVELNGAKFESLPVQIETSGTVIHAILRLSVRAGFAFEADLLPGPEIELGPFNSEDWKASAGLETKLYVNVADLKSNITAFGEEDCPLQIEESFQFAVGAAAGAYVGIGEQTWGPRPQTEVPIFPTTFAKTCLSQEAQATAKVRFQRAESESGIETVTLSRDKTYTAKGCVEPGVIDCPASAQVVKEYQSMETLITTALAGASVTWPETIVTRVASTKGFGDNAIDINSSASGSTTPTATGGQNGDSGFFDKSSGGVSNKLIIGLSVGLGVPVLLAIIGGIMIYVRKRRSFVYSPQPQVASEDIQVENKG
ncbi:unnamed protein product [Clonostachys rosea f. rosea IK726]|uniref:Mid2 domain-containing protein n=2 Tax=Bionectria ochroleuca TaxID=29856 RepID=A0A0B7KG45_BIOOC|nr:unnamed protein product [Clonostachys rosea f. rosea IK726]